MPTVPQYDTAQVAPAGMPNVQVQGLNIRQLYQGELQGQEIEQAGDASARAGVQGLDEQTRAQILANQSRVDAAQATLEDAKNQALYGTPDDPSSGALAQKGAAAVEPNAQGQNLADAYTQKLQGVISQQTQGLANDAQRQAFQDQATRTLVQFRGQLDQHVAQESAQYNLDTQKSLLANAQDDAVRNWGTYGQQGGALDDAVQRAQRSAAMLGQLQGLDGITASRNIQAAGGALYQAAAGAALENNRPDLAAQIVKEHPEIDPESAIKLQTQITADMQARTATSAVQAATSQYQSAFQPSDVDRAFNIALGSESGGQQFDAQGQPLTSAKGAEGIAQVMPGTGPEAAKLAGLPWDPQRLANDPEYNRALGRAYFAQQLQANGNDVQKAWAAYNAGPGALDAAVKAAGPGGDWLAHMPAETQAYVQKNMAALQSGGGAPALPSQQDFLSGIRQRLGPNPDPMVLQRALDEGSRQYAAILQGRKDQGEQAVQQAQQYLAQNHGDYNSMPPGLLSQVTQFAPDKIPDLQVFAGKIADPPVKDNMAEYIRAIDHPEKLTNMSDSDFNHFLTTNFSQATQEQISRLRGQNLKGEQSLDLTTINGLVNSRLATIGLGTRLQQVTGPGATQIAQVRKSINDDVLVQQHRLGRQMTAGELEGFIDQRFSSQEQGTPQSLWHGASDASPTLTMNASDIPASARASMLKDFAAHHNTSPSGDQLLAYYRYLKSKGTF